MRRHVLSALAAAAALIGVMPPAPAAPVPAGSAMRNQPAAASAERASATTPRTTPAPSTRRRTFRPYGGEPLAPWIDSRGNPLRAVFGARRW